MTFGITAGRIGRRRRTRPVLVVIGLAGSLLAGCLNGPNEPLGPFRTTEAPNAIEVSVTHSVLAVHFNPEEIAPRPKDVEALNVLLATGDILPGDSVRIERAASVLADARARGLASALARQGLKATLAPPGGAPEGELRLVVEHATTSVPDCPNWTKPPGNDLENTLHSNFGCASAIDLAAMVADPRDLVEGRPLAPLVGDAAIFPMIRYRTGLPEKDSGSAAEPFQDATTFMATAPTKPQSPPGAGDKAPSGATGGGAAAAAIAGAGLAPGGYAAPSGGPQ